MKEEVREKTVKQNYTIYIANDGTEFNDKKECELYDYSARCAALARYKDLVLARKTEDALFCIGSDEYEIDLVRIINTEQVSLIIQLVNLFYKKSEEYNSELYNRLMSYLENNEIFLIGRGTSYDRYDNFWVMYSIPELTKRLNDAIN